MFDDDDPEDYPELDGDPSFELEDEPEDTADLDSPTDWDEYEMNPDDCADEGDQYDIEYDR